MIVLKILVNKIHKEINKWKGQLGRFSQEILGVAHIFVCHHPVTPAKKFRTANDQRTFDIPTSEVFHWESWLSLIEECVSGEIWSFYVIILGVFKVFLFLFMSWGHEYYFGLNVN